MKQAFWRRREQPWIWVIGSVLAAVDFAAWEHTDGKRLGGFDTPRPRGREGRRQGRDGGKEVGRKERRKEFGHQKENENKKRNQRRKGRRTERRTGRMKARSNVTEEQDRETKNQVCSYFTETPDAGKGRTKREPARKR